MLQLIPGMARTCRFFSLLVLTLMSTSAVQAMTAGEALRLTQAWAFSSGASADLARMKVQPAGDFELEIRGANLAYQSKTRQLIVSGLVGQDMLPLTRSPAIWQELQTAASREATTMGEGRFALVLTTKLNADPPVLLLSKAFEDGAMSEQQFLIELRWLLEWATHWRKTRLRELLSGSSPEELARQGTAYVTWAREKRPRPW